MRCLAVRLWLRYWPACEIVGIYLLFASILFFAACLSGCIPLGQAAGAGLAGATAGATSGSISTPPAGASALEYVAYTVGSILGSYVAIKGTGLIAGKLKPRNAP